MVVVGPYDHDEAAILQKLSRALNNPDEDYLKIKKGPISSAIASAIEKLLLSAKHQKRWRVWLAECWPEDDDACSILSQAFYKAFSQGRIGRLSLNGLVSTNKVERDMLLAVLGTSDLNNDSQHNPTDLCLFDCIFDHTMMPHLQAWARGAATVLKLTITGDCFVCPDTPTTTECVAKMFGQTREKPTDLELKNVSLIGDMACLRDWRVESILIEGSSQVRTLSGLSSMAPSLKKLVMNLYHHVNIPLAEMDMDIIALLEDPHCCLEDLTLSFHHVENAFTLALFEALGNVQSLASLKICKIKINDPSIWHVMLDYLRSNPPSLKELLVHESMILEIPSAANDICNVLRSENNALKKIYFDFRTTIESRELKASVLPYLVRNRAGRRILQDEQVPPSLMADVLGRTQQMEIVSFYSVDYSEPIVLRADATYHLVREGLAFLFS